MWDNMDMQQEDVETPGVLSERAICAAQLAELISMWPRQSEQERRLARIKTVIFMERKRQAFFIVLGTALLASLSMALFVRPLAVEVAVALGVMIGVLIIALLVTWLT